MDATPSSQRPRSRWMVVSAIVALIIVVAIGGLVSWLSTPAALQFAIDRVVAASEGKLSIEGLEGTLLGPLHANRITWRDEGTSLAAEDVAIDPTARALLSGRLVLRELRIRRLAIAFDESRAAAPTMPQSVALPIDVDIARVIVDRIDWTSAGETTTLTDASFGFVSDQRAHQIRSLRVHAQGTTLTGTASVGTTLPFATSGAASLLLVKPRPEGRVDLKFDGNLETLELAMRSDIAEVVAEGRARLAPFAARPFIEGRANARDINLARFDAKWPTTRLNATFEAVPAQDGYAGKLAIENALAGPIDANRLPIVAVDARYALTGRRFDLASIAARLNGGAALSGSGSLDLDSLASRWKLGVQRVDLKSLHTKLVASALSGSVDADVDDKGQRVIGDVSQKDLRLAFDLRYDGEKLLVTRALAQSQGGSLEGSGRFDVAGKQPFSMEARAMRFNPARFGDFPAGSLDGTITAKGMLEPRLSADADVAIARGSRFAGLATQGRARAHVTPDSISALDADVTLGSNRVVAKGAYGQTGDRLQLAVAAKRMAELAPLLPDEVPQPLTGALEGNVTLKARERGARMVVNARGRDLAIGKDIRFGTLSVDASGVHDAPLTTPRVDALRDVVLKAAATNAVLPQARATRANIAFNGSASSHTLELAVTTPDGTLESSLQASLLGMPDAPRWRGRVDALSVRGLPVVTEAKLAAPTTFELGGNHVIVGALRVEGGKTFVESDGITYRDGVLDTRGQFRGLPLAPLAHRIGIDERFPIDLVVAGAWDVTSKPAWRGTLSIRRESGDLYVDDPGDDRAKKLALGIQTLMLQARLDGRRVAGNAEVDAKLGGTAQAQFVIEAPASAPHPFVGASTVRATVHAELPRLATLQPWIGTAARVQGQLNADLTIAGTLDKPIVTGNVVASDLRYDMPQYGINLHDGVLRLASNGEGVRLEELRFRSGEGTFVASGQIGLPREGGSQSPSKIGWKAENFRAVNRPELRLVVDGEGTLAYEAKRLVLRGRIAADEGYIEYRSRDETRLADDIVVVGRARPGRSEESAIANLPLDFDLAIELGRNLRFSGEGLDARLAGRVQVASLNGAPMTAKGTIRAARGTFTAFGQRLDIERGRVLFDGPVANPSLDVVALRKNQAVEAGVEISGTVRAPIVRLTSNPPVPDNEKLSWLITGGPAGSTSARESAALSAATAALFGRGGRPLTQTFAERVGLDDISVSRREGASASDPVGAQVLTLGKRITDKLYVAFEQGLSAASGAVRIEYILSRYLTVSAFAGADSGLALNFRRSWP
ncbi:MAG TPA: translocation/assembly module TamB domain-containing protein [Casimicrobiaceae bacterium]|nr:translocation/assembly module TamB domain-containing protein [Casimicrobiaceae bacterium]